MADTVTLQAAVREVLWGIQAHIEASLAGPDRSSCLDELEEIELGLAVVVALVGPKPLTSRVLSLIRQRASDLFIDLIANPSSADADADESTVALSILIHESTNPSEAGISLAGLSDQDVGDRLGVMVFPVFLRQVDAFSRTARELIVRLPPAPSVETFRLALDLIDNCVRRLGSPALPPPRHALTKRQGSSKRQTERSSPTGYTWGRWVLDWTKYAAAYTAGFLFGFGSSLARPTPWLRAVGGVLNKELRASWDSIDS